MSERDLRWAWFNCHAGVAGDMLLAALVDAGADPDAVADAVAGLGVDGYAILFERVQRCGVGATWANIVTHDQLAKHHQYEHHHQKNDAQKNGRPKNDGQNADEQNSDEDNSDDPNVHDQNVDDQNSDDQNSDEQNSDEQNVHDQNGDDENVHDQNGDDQNSDDEGSEHDPVNDDEHDEPLDVDHDLHRPASEVLALLDAADLTERIRVRARAVFERLTEVEGAIHGIDPADVELHEVGALDSIIDVVGVCAALESLDIDVIGCSSIGLGSGIVQTAHGALSHPAPATMALLTAAGAPTHGLPMTLETATPTGAALMTTLATSFGPMPTGTSTAVGYGAGTADPPGRANVVQVVIGQGVAQSAATIDDGAAVVQLDANVDDVTGEVLAHTVDALLAAGAHDAWVTPIVMKKGRPAHTVSALCDPSSVARVRDVLLAETGTLGVRATSLVRWPQQRQMTSVDVGGHAVGIKIAAHRIKVEFDDAARVAHALLLPVRVVIERAVAAASAIVQPPDRSH